MHCPSCGAPSAPEAHSCSSCGATLTRGTTRAGFIIGRDPACDVVLPANDTRISRRHARVTPLGGGRYQIEDLGSSNGVQVNGRPVKTAQIGLQDAISFGTFRLDTGLLASLPERTPRAAGDEGGRWQTIGRDPGCDIVLPLHLDGVSRQHARVRRLPGDRFEIEDLGSSNGMKVNGVQVPRAEVGPRDRVQLGSAPIALAELMARSPRAAPSPATPATPASPAATLSADPGARSIPAWVPVLAAVLLLVLGAGAFWLLQSGVEFGGGPSREVLSPTEALARMERVLATSPDLEAHFEAYGVIAEELDPIRDRVLEADALYQIFEDLSEAELMGVPVWETLVETHPAAQVADVFFHALGRAIQQARSLSDQLHDLPVQIRSSRDALRRAALEPSVAQVLEARTGLVQTSSHLSRLCSDLRPFQTTLETVVTELGSARQATGELSEHAGIGDFASAVAAGLAELAQPFEAARDWIASFRGALDSDARALQSAASSLDEVDIE